MIARVAPRFLCGLLIVAISGAAAAQESDLISLIQSVQPTFYSFLPSPLEILPDDNASVALAVTDLELEDGGVLAAGELVGPGLAVKAGVIWNLSETSMSVASARGDVDIVLPDELVVIARQQPQEMAPQPIPGYSVTQDAQGNVIAISKQFSVSCGQGYYACCYEFNGRAVCRCIRNGESEPTGGCTAGGPGSSSCSISLR